MFKEIESFTEKVAEKVKSAEDEVKQFFTGIKTSSILLFQHDIAFFEKSLLAEGIKLDDEFVADLAKIKAKLEAEEAALNPPKAAV